MICKSRLEKKKKKSCERRQLIGVSRQETNRGGENSVAHSGLGPGRETYRKYFCGSPTTQWFRQTNETENE
jgi:hypothetical protein